jgi:hypothetical protein
LFTFTRSQLRQFRAVLRKAKIDKQPGVTPKLILIAMGDRYALQVMSDTVAVELSVQAECSHDRIVLPLSVLNDCESRSSDPVTIRRTSDDRISMEWTDQRIPQVREYACEPTDDLPAFPNMPETLSSNQAGLWLALREAVESADPASTRYALDCLQLRGETGQIAATDGQQALAQTGFTFPWTTDVLIPASGILGFRELPEDQPVSVGRTVDWVTLVNGDWRLALKVEKERHFPKLDAIIPTRASSSSRLNLAADDARFLTSTLSKLPIADDFHRPVTIELNGHVVIRGKGADDSRPTELLLSQSRLEGTPVTCQMNRDFLARAVRLGFREVCISKPDAPAFCDDGQRQFVWALMEPKNAIRAQADSVRIESPAIHATPSSPTSKPPQPQPSKLTRTSSLMPETQVDRTASSPAENPRTDSRTMTSLIDDAEALRTSLRDALSKTNALVVGLKRQWQQSKLMRSTLQSLRALQSIEA